MIKLKLQKDSQTVYFCLLGLVVILVISSAIAANEIVKLLGKQANQLTSYKAQSQALGTEQTNLTSAKAEVKKYTSLEKIAESIVPQDKDQAETVREIVAIAQQSNMTLTSIVFPTSTLGTVTAPSGASTPTEIAPTPSKSSISLSQLTPVVGIPGVYSLPIDVEDSQQSDAVSYSNFLTFLTKLEQNRRTSLVTGLSIQPITGGLITFSLTINEYIKPQ